LISRIVDDERMPKCIDKIMTIFSKQQDNISFEIPCYTIAFLQVQA
jgi:hypothetical protein